MKKHMPEFGSAKNPVVMSGNGGTAWGSAACATDGAAPISATRMPPNAASIFSLESPLRVEFTTLPACKKR